MLIAKDPKLKPMKKTRYLLLPILLSAGLLASCCNDQNCKKKTVPGNIKKAEKESCGISCMARNKSGELSCKLSAPEIRQRKETVLASLKKQVLEKKALKNGYAYKFPGTDKMLDELTEFIKTERQCCDFFVFNLSISGDKSEIWLELTGVEGAKDFIDGELAI